MSIPPKYDLRFYEGDDDSLILRYKDSDGVGIDISADALVFNIVDCVTGDSVLSINGVVTSPVYEVVFPISSVETIGLSSDKGIQPYYYDVQITYNSDSSIETLLRGYCTFYKQSI